MLKKYSELTKEQKSKVQVMYSDPSNLEMYLYNFDENGNYHGRQFTPEMGVIHAESTVPEKDISYQDLHNNPLTDEEKDNKDWEYPNDQEKKSEKKVTPKKNKKK